MIASRTRPQTHLLLLAAAVVAGALAVGVSPYVALALIGVAVAAYLLLSPALGIPLLLVVAALNRLAYPWGDSQIRLEILVALLLGIVVANRVAVRTMSVQRLSSPLLLPLLAYAATNIFSSVLFASEKTRGLKLDAEILAALLFYVVFVALLSRQNLPLTIKMVWIVTVAEAVIGLILMIGYVAHLTSAGVQQGDFGLPMVYGTQWEANIFGSYLLGNFFILLADYLAGNRSGWRTVGLVLVVAGIGVSMTRTAWLALVLGTIIFFVAAVRIRRAGNLMGILAAIPVLAILGLIVGSATPFAGRLLDVVNLHTSSASGRFTMFNAAISDWRSHPIFGLGTGSFNFGAVPGQAHPWLSNLTLLTLHDAGIAGALALAWLLWRFYRAMLSALRPGYYGILAAGALAGFTALFIAFQTTTGFWFAYPWIVAAIGVTAAKLARETA